MTGHSSINTAFLTEEALVSFIEALYRIFKVGIYYPRGHVVLDQSASNCVAELREISSNLKSIKIVIDSSGLLVEELRLSDSSVAVKELHLLFTKLGIHSVEIERTISPQKLLSVVIKLLNWRMEIESAQSLLTFDFADIPDGICLEQQQFLVDKRTIKREGQESDFGHHIDEICRALADQGLDSRQIENCQGLLEKLAKSGQAEHQDIKGFPNASWRDVQDLLFTVVTDAYSLDEKRYENIANNDINILASIFKSLEFDVEDKRSKETIDLLISHLTGKSGEPQKKVEKKTESKTKLRQLLDDDQKLTFDDLKTFIYQNSIPLKILGQITSVDSSEEMSILMQLISPDLDGLSKKRIDKKLQAILTGGMTDREKDVLIGGLILLVDQGNVAEFHRLLTMVLQTLRDVEQLNSLAFVIDLWGKIPFAMQLLVWPFVVNESLVIGMVAGRQTFIEAIEIASHMHIERMKSLSPHLELMDGFLEKEIAEEFFIPENIKSYRLFGVLLETSLGSTLGEIILAALREKPQDSLFKAIGPILELEVPAHLQFLQAYLGQAHLDEPPLPLKMAVGEIVIDFLENINAEDRDLPWLESTISAMVDFNSKGMVEMLGRIVKEKKLGMLPLWPKKCRIAAAAVLKSLKRRRTLSKLL